MKRFVKDIRKYADYAVYSAKSSLKAEVANSYLNWLWWILDPLLFMLVYMFIGLIVYNEPEQHFALFVFIGLTIWNFFSKTVQSSVKLVSGAKSIISKIYLPKYVLIFAKMLNHFVKLLISFGIILVMMIVYRVPYTWAMLQLLPVLLTLMIVTFGFSVILMHCGVFFEDLHNLVHVGLRLVFYLSGVFYSIESRIGGLYGGWLLKGNPVALCIDAARRVLIDGAVPQYDWLLIWFGIGSALSVIGIALVYRYENSYVKVI